jgi:hypothetical protein
LHGSNPRVVSDGLLSSLKKYACWLGKFQNNSAWGFAE